MKQFENNLQTAQLVYKLIKSKQAGLVPIKLTVNGKNGQFQRTYWVKPAIAQAFQEGKIKTPEDLKRFKDNTSNDTPTKDENKNTQPKETTFDDTQTKEQDNIPNENKNTLNENNSQKIENLDSESIKSLSPLQMQGVINKLKEYNVLNNILTVTEREKERDVQNKLILGVIKKLKERGIYPSGEITEANLPEPEEKKKEKEYLEKARAYFEKLPIINIDKTMGKYLAQIAPIKRSVEKGTLPKMYLDDAILRKDVVFKVGRETKQKNFKKYISSLTGYKDFICVHHLQHSVEEEDKQLVVDYAKDVMKKNPWIKANTLDTSTEGIRNAVAVIFKEKNITKSVLASIPKVIDYKTVHECKDFNEISAYMLHHHNIGVYKGVNKLNIEMVKSAFDGVDLMMKKFPKLSTYMNSINGFNLKTSFMDASSTTGSINLNTEYFKLPEYDLEFTKSAGVHELAHILEFKLSEKIADGPVGNFCYSDKAISKAIVKEAYNNLTRTEKILFPTLHGAIKNISKYALTNDCETLAEAVGFIGGKYNFSEEMEKTNKPLAREIVKLVMKRYNEEFKNG